MVRRRCWCGCGALAAPGKFLAKGCNSPVDVWSERAPEMRALVKFGATVEDIAARYGVSHRAAHLGLRRQGFELRWVYTGIKQTRSK